MDGKSSIGKFTDGKSTDVTVNAGDLLALLTGEADQETKDRVAKEYNRAFRKTPPASPTKEQMRRLVELFVVGETIKPFVSVDPVYIQRERGLLSDGWIEFGVLRGERVWAMSGQKERWEEPTPLCRLQPRGLYHVKTYLMDMAADRCRAVAAERVRLDQQSAQELINQTIISQTMTYK